MQKAIRKAYKEEKKKQMVHHMALSGIASALLTAAMFLVDEMLRQKKNKA